MTFVPRAARPFAAFTALAVLVTGLALAPTSAVTAEAASAASQTKSTISKVNSYRSSAKLAKFKTGPVVAGLATEVAGLLAAEGTTDIESVGSNTVLTSALSIPTDSEFQAYRVTGSSSSVASSVAKKIKAASDKADKTGYYGDFNYLGLGFKKKGKYTYAFAFFAKYDQKIQSSPTIKVSGTPEVGKTLKAKFTGSSKGERNYIWYAGSYGYLGSGSSIVLPASAAGKKVHVQVSIARDGYHTITRNSKSTAKVALKKLSSKTPTVTGSYVVGKTLSANTGTWTAGTEFRYQWKADGKSIADAKSPTYVIVAADRGKKITVSVKGFQEGYASVTKTSVNKTATLGVFESPTPTISAPANTVGTVLTAGIGTWTPKASKYTYQWFRGGVAISKATAKTYTTVTADDGKAITVTVTGTKSGYKARSVTSAPLYFGPSVG